MIITTVILLGAFQGLILSVILFFRKHNSAPNRIFSVLLFVLVFDLMSIYFQLSGFAEKYPHVLYLNENLPYLYAPLIYFYIETITGKISSFKLIYVLNFLPFLIDLFSTSILFFFTSSEYKLAVYMGQKSSGSLLQSFVLTTVLFLIALVYHILLFRRLSRYTRDLKNYYSSFEKQKYGWLVTVLAVSAFIWSVVIAMTYADFASILPGDIAVNIRTFIGILYTLTIYISAYRMLTLPEIFMPNTEMTAVFENAGTLRVAKGKREFEIFKDYIEKNRCYLEPEITIREICHAVDVPVYLISKEMNTSLRKNFYFFINEYRVQEAKRLLADAGNSSKSVLAIALDAGFNSKSTFNEFFKKITGITPSEYRAQTLKSPMSE